MPQFGSLRGKMLALILTPVALAIVLMTLFAISRASSEQKKTAFSELQQRTASQAAGVDTAIAKPLELAKATAAILGGSVHREDAANSLKALMKDNKGSVVALFGAVLPNTFDGADATSKGAVGSDPKTGGFAPSASFGED